MGQYLVQIFSGLLLLTSMTLSLAAKHNAFVLFRACGIYEPPTKQQVEIMRGVFKHLFTSSDTKTFNVHMPNYMAKSWSFKAHRLLVLQEKVSNCKGTGDYAIRYGKTTPILLEAPHRFADRLTGYIARELFLDSPFKAAAWNSANRYTRVSWESNQADMEFLPISYMMAFSQAFLQAEPKGIIVQLHGFSIKKRKEKRARMAAIVVSQGIEDPDVRLDKLVQCLRKRVIPFVYAYPSEVGELGATKNIIGQWVNKKQKGNFFHIELSAAMRYRLHYDKGVRQSFSVCLRQLANS